MNLIEYRILHELSCSKWGFLDGSSAMSISERKDFIAMQEALEQSEAVMFTNAFIEKVRAVRNDTTSELRKAMLNWVFLYFHTKEMPWNAEISNAAKRAKILIEKDFTVPKFFEVEEE